MTREQFITEEKNNAGEFWSDNFIPECNEQWYKETIAGITQFTGTITKEEYNSMTDGQKYHFNKHYNIAGDKVS